MAPFTYYGSRDRGAMLEMCVSKQLLLFFPRRPAKVLNSPHLRPDVRSPGRIQCRRESTGANQRRHRKSGTAEPLPLPRVRRDGDAMSLPALVVAWRMVRCSRISIAIWSMRSLWQRCAEEIVASVCASPKPGGCSALGNRACL